ncbi:putative conserved secreted CHAT domain-containing protein [Synechococcus sp. RS9909]|uniref:CHAT domain-containing protein n=1 Tax=Synechococcus sp. RS9909 TaxID=221352 RepID=UPI00006906F3|nr:CHAT domain-containing protein [Synechococcus sp. RS9909]EAQ70461.1 Filamentous haemagglutinin-like [Synechococcus sp. RS9917]QNI80668.1 putative conserved secreted CHAT domain-containing protein [Synechococcus sp. RS9909]
MKASSVLSLLLVVSGLGSAVRAQVTADPSLGSRVNGALGGSCNSGICRIGGGQDAGTNRFHRLRQFDTRGAIQSVEIQSDGIRNLVLGVTASEGSFIDKAVALTSPAHLFLLSPGGIQLMPGAGFLQVPQLTLSTASQLHFPGGVFDVLRSPASALTALHGDPLPGQLGLRGVLDEDRRPWIRMEGISIDVEESLLVDAPGGRIDVESSRLSASNSSGDGGTLTLTADQVRVGAGSALLATGSRDGGLVQVGGSWQNSDPTVRQAAQTWVQPGSLVDASSTGQGDGGTVVIWSDLNNSSGGTVVEGTLLARGGPLGGNGGRVETSGAFLLAKPERLDVGAVGGVVGEWLLDPYNITISTTTGNTFDVTDPVDPNGRLFESTSSPSLIDVDDLDTALGTSTNVRIATGPGTTSEGGNITWQAGAPLDYSSSTGRLVLDASGYIKLNSNITTGSGGLTLNAGAGFVEGAAAATLALNGPLKISTGDSTIGTPGASAPAFAATLSGNGDLFKVGNGRLILSGNNSGWTGAATVEAGALRLLDANALGSAAASTTVESGAALELSGGLNVGEPIMLKGGTLRNWSGVNTLSSTLTLNGTSSLDLRQDRLILSPISGNAVTVDPAASAFASNLNATGDGALTSSAAINLGDGQTPTGYGDFTQSGSGDIRFQDTLFLRRLAATGGGTLWLDQPVGSVVIDGGNPITIALSGGSLLRRDASETVTGVALELGSGGGGISVNDAAATLIWDAPISGRGDFIKQGDGTLRFASSAAIIYSGQTLVEAGVLDVLSSSPTSATCSGSGTSNLCTEPDPGPEPTPDPEPTPEPIPIPRATSTDAEDREAVVALDAVAEAPPLQPALQLAATQDALDPESSLGAASLASQTAPQTTALVVDLGQGGSDAAEASRVPSSEAPTVVALSADEAVDQLRGADQEATQRTVAALGLSDGLAGTVPETPSLTQIQTTLQQVQQQAQARDGVKPAVLQVRFTAQNESFLDLTLVPASGEVVSRRVAVSRERFAALLKALYRQLSRQESLEVSDPRSASRQLHQLLIEPIQQGLRDQGITTLLIAADQGLQAVPFAALSDGATYFGTRYAFGLTPSLALTDLNAATRSSGLLAMGASEFEGLAPLPLVPQELSNIQDAVSTDRYLNSAFTPSTLIALASDPRYGRVHVATHADFRPGGPSRSVLHTGAGPMSMAAFARLRRQRSEAPLDLVVLSACRTLLGDPDSELGFAGLALQAGARSAVGTLWYVDDVVTSAFFVQFYRFLEQGVPKAEALQRTRQLFAQGQVQLQGDRVIGAMGEPLLRDLDAAQRRRVAGGMENPFFWAGIELIGSPW